MKKTPPLLLLFIMLAFGVHGQSIGPSTTNATGGSKVIGGNTYEYSVGEMTLVNTATASGIVVTQGVLQPKMESTGIKELTLSGLVQVYPNPTEQFVYLDVQFKSYASLSYQLLDATGKLILSSAKTIPSGREKISINLASYAAGNYLLNVKATQASMQFAETYKIQKTH